MLFSDKSGRVLNLHTRNTTIIMVFKPIDTMSMAFPPTHHTISSQRGRDGETPSDPSSQTHDEYLFTSNRDLEKLDMATADNSTLHGSESASLDTPSDTKSEPTNETILVQWNGPKDPDNPRNWSKKKRWTVTLVVSLFTFIRSVCPLPRPVLAFLTLVNLQSSGVFYIITGFATDFKRLAHSTWFHPRKHVALYICPSLRVGST